ncbi:diphosphomevalonate decarboxylase [Schaalia vaccimaxillae]|uniref:diphosphomevalonate decarboxylase n=1 Tax=Schaalia vaccimaxillae TaxID=183916 RepID=UPI0003B3E5CE|nr:diphosphomevalonate decarboxylase [Schaalia vaccimaxillae]
MTTSSTSSASATASANSNIALIKYWGKANPALSLPTTSSLSLTLDDTWTTTRVSFDDGNHGLDQVSINGKQASGTSLERVSRFLDLVRKRAGLNQAATVESHSTVPLAAGLASSAAGFAALAGAASRAAGLDLDERDLSRLARRGSGSACRSIFGGLVLWNKGTDDHSSYAEPVATDLNLAMVVVTVESGKKSISSSRAMKHTLTTSPLYPSWVQSSATDVLDALDAAATADLQRLGDIAEANALGMHATMLAARPAVMYWLPSTVEVLSLVQRLRAEGLPVWATIDAGPNVKVLTDRAHAQQACAALSQHVPNASVTLRLSGEGIRFDQARA